MTDVDAVHALLKTTQFGALAKLQRTFSIISLFDDVFCENAYSRVLRFLLDSKNEHNLGIAAGRILVNSVKAESPRFPSAIVAALDSNVHIDSFIEWPTATGRRLDILLEIRSQKSGCVAVVGIENKIDAGEQERQLSDYQQAICEKYRDVPKALIFLSPDGRGPTTASSESNCPCIATSGQVVINVCRETAPRTIGDVRLLVEGLSSYFEGKSKMNDDAKRLIYKLYADEKHRKAIELIRELAPPSRANRLFEELFEECQSSKGEKHFRALATENLMVKGSHPHARIIFHEGADFDIGYMWHSREWPVKKGTKFTMRLMAWCESLRARRTLERLLDQSYFPKCGETPVEWYGKKEGKRQYKCWFNIWTGESYALKDFSRADKQNLKSILQNTMKKIHRTVVTRLEKMPGSVRTNNSR